VHTQEKVCCPLPVFTPPHTCGQPEKHTSHTDSDASGLMDAWEDAPSSGQGGIGFLRNRYLAGG
ncbi:hypothetical protein CDAR_440581, partial [Caerostris darwini]